MAVSISSAENALKSIYLNVVANQLNVNANPLLAKIKQSDANVWGNEIVKLAPFGINGGIGAGSDTGSLPSAAGNKYVQFKSTLKNLFGRIEISDKAIRASENNAGAFVNLLNDEMEGLIKASSFNLGRMLYGDGSGELCATTANFTSTSTYFTVDDVRNLIEGIVIDVYSNGIKDTAVSGGRISYIDRTNKRVYTDKMTVTTTISSGAKFYVQGSKDNEITGIEALFGSGDLYGLSRTTYPWLNPYTNNAGLTMNDITIQTVIDAIEDKGGSEVDFIAVSRDVKKLYVEYLTYYKRNIEVIELEGGFKAISYNGIPIVADRFIASQTAYFLSTKDFTLHQLCDWQWLEGEDGKVIKQNPGFPTYNATLVKYAELICDRPLGQAKLSNIANSVVNPYNSITDSLSTIATETGQIVVNTTPSGA